MQQGGSTASASFTRQKETVKKTKARKTKDIDEKIVTLRSALFLPNGKDKDVTSGIAPAFLSFTRNDLNLNISFSTKLKSSQRNYCFDLCKASMEERYDASGYGWDDGDKENELTEEGTRFLLIRDLNKAKTDNDQLVGFAHFRFSIQGELLDVMKGDTCVFLWDIHLEEEYQRRGVGKHIMTLLELIARREKMSYVAIPVQLEDEVTSNWVKNCLKGYSDMSPDLMELLGFDSDAEGFQVYGKHLGAPVKKPAATATATATSKSEVVFNFGNNNSAVDEKLNEKQKLSAPADADVGALNDSMGEILNLSTSSSEGDENTTGVDSLESSRDNEEEEEEEGETDLSSLNEYDVIHGLKVLYRQKHGRDASDDEVDQWLSALQASRE